MMNTLQQKTIKTSNYRQIFPIAKLDCRGEGKKIIWKHNKTNVRQD